MHMFEWWRHQQTFFDKAVSSDIWESVAKSSHMSCVCQRFEFKSLFIIFFPKLKVIFAFELISIWYAGQHLLLGDQGSVSWRAFQGRWPRLIVQYRNLLKAHDVMLARLWAESPFHPVSAKKGHTRAILICKLSWMEQHFHPRANKKTCRIIYRGLWLVECLSAT